MRIACDEIQKEEKKEAGIYGEFSTQVAPGDLSQGTHHPPLLPSYCHDVQQYLSCEDDGAEAHSHQHFCASLEFGEDKKKGLREKEHQHDETGQHIPPIFKGLGNFPTLNCFFGAEMLEFLLIGRVAKGVVSAEFAGYVSAEIEDALSMEGVSFRGVVDGMLIS